MVSLGCPKALVDSERILTKLRADGYGLSPDYAGADVVLVNTCGFLDSAKEESLEAIGEAIAENGRVIVTGCMGNEADVIRARFPDVLAITGAHQYEAVVSAVHEAAPPTRGAFVDLVPEGPQADAKVVSRAVILDADLVRPVLLAVKLGERQGVAIGGKSGGLVADAGADEGIDRVRHLVGKTQRGRDEPLVTVAADGGVGNTEVGNGGGAHRPVDFGLMIVHPQAAIHGEAVGGVPGQVAVGGEVELVDGEAGVLDEVREDGDEHGELARGEALVLRPHLEETCTPGKGAGVVVGGKAQLVGDEVLLLGDGRAGVREAVGRLGEIEVQIDRGWIEVPGLVAGDGFDFAPGQVFQRVEGGLVALELGRAPEIRGIRKGIRREERRKPLGSIVDILRVEAQAEFEVVAGVPE